MIFLLYDVIGSVHVYRYSTKSDIPEIEKTVSTRNLKNNGYDGPLIHEKEVVLVKGKNTENKESTVKTQTFELETVLSPTKTTPYSCFGHTHHVTGKYGRHGTRG